MKDTRMNPSYRPALDNGFSMYYQEACTTKSYKKKNYFHKGRDQIPYGYPLCLTGEVWDAYVNNPFDSSTRKEFLSKISLSCIDKKKETKMMPPYAFTLENVKLKDKERLMQGITMGFTLPLELYTILLQKCRTVF